MDHIEWRIDPAFKKSPKTRVFPIKAKSVVIS